MTHCNYWLWRWSKKNKIEFDFIKLQHELIWISWLLDSWLALLGGQLRHQDIFKIPSFSKSPNSKSFMIDFYTINLFGRFDSIHKLRFVLNPSLKLYLLVAQVNFKTRHNFLFLLKFFAESRRQYIQRHLFGKITFSNRLIFNFVRISESNMPTLLLDQFHQLCSLI